MVMENRSILSLEKLLLGSSSRLKNIVRFSNSHRIQDESVAEHSFSTALYSLVIGEDLRDQGVEINVELAVKRALLHDIEESHSGDFIRQFKHSDPILKEAIEKASEKFAVQLFREMSPQGATKLLKLWANAKERTCEGMLVEFADFLSVLAYIAREVKMGNMSILVENQESLQVYSRKFDMERYDFLRYYIKAAQALLTETIRVCTCAPKTSTRVKEKA